MLRAVAPACLATLAAACSAPAEKPPRPPLGQIPTAVTSAQPEWIPVVIRAGEPVPSDPRERRLTEMRRLTFGDGDNAEARWSPDGKQIIFQSTREGRACDQVYVMDLGSGDTKRVSTGGGRATAGSFVFPAGDRAVYASTLAAGASCPPRPDRSLGDVWSLDPSQIYGSRLDGGDRRLLDGGKGYNAEGNTSFDGRRLVFTSTRDGDLDLYTARADGSDIHRVTHAAGYDGGASFSPDGTKLVWRAGRPKGADLDDYRALLARNLVKPTALDIVVAGSEGQNARQITRNGKTNLAPSFLPDSRRVIFASNWDAAPTQSRAEGFDLYVIDPDAPPTMEGVPPLERITFYDGFDSSPAFSPDGEHLIFASTRSGSRPGETNIFVARWVE